MGCCPSPTTDLVAVDDVYPSDTVGWAEIGGDAFVATSYRYIYRLRNISVRFPDREEQINDDLWVDSGTGSIDWGEMSDNDTDTIWVWTYEDSCFTEDTLVLTPKGRTPISHLEVGDMVMARNEDTGIDTPQRIDHLHLHPQEFIFEIETTSGLIIETTRAHPFRSNGRWVEAQHLVAGEFLETRTGLLEVARVERTEVKTVFNLTVENDSTYFVTDEDVWVHNK